MKILNGIRSNRIGYYLGRAILTNEFITNNSLYRYLYNNRIKQLIRELETRPPMVDIGTTNYCNANCIMCPHNQLTNMGTMSLIDYKKIIDDCYDFGVKMINLSFFGEPLLDKTLIEKIKYAKSKNMFVSFYTNASLLNNKRANELIDVDLDSITISFDSNDKETYEKIRRGLNFDIVKANIINLIILRNKLNSSLKINLVIVELEENKDEIKSLYRYWKDDIDSINIINMRNWANAINKKGTKDSIHYKSKDRAPCALLWQKMVVDWNSDVVLCCDDYQHRIILGNLKKQTIKEMWEGDRLKTIREYHLNGEFNKIFLCQKCNKNTIWWLVR